MIGRAIKRDIPVVCPMNFDTCVPTNLIQAQRDFFGAHTYERIHEKGTFPTKWEE